MSLTVEALGGRTVATEPERHFETLRGGFLSRPRRFGDD